MNVIRLAPSITGEELYGTKPNKDIRRVAKNGSKARAAAQRFKKESKAMQERVNCERSRASVDLLG